MPGTTIYTLRLMTDLHHSLRIPRRLWEQYADVVGSIGRTSDLKRFMEWRMDDPETVLGEDVAPPHDFLATFRIEPVRWDLFAGNVAEGDVSAELRRYIHWRVRHPDAPLPGRRLPPIRRHTRRVACV